MSSGALAGYWVHETNDSFVRGLTQRDNFDPDKHVTLEPGRYLGMRFDWLGRIKASKAYTFGHERTRVDLGARHHQRPPLPHAQLRPARRLLGAGHATGSPGLTECGASRHRRIGGDVDRRRSPT